jgi:hypothetical protein
MNTTLNLLLCVFCVIVPTSRGFQLGSSPNILNVSCPCTPHAHPVPFIILAFRIKSVGLTIRPTELRKR